MSARRTAIARADGSAELGMGNVTRALALCEALERRGFRVLFVGRDYDPRVRSHVERAGVEFRGIDPASSLETDVIHVRSIVEDERAELAVVDLSNTQATRDLEHYSRYLGLLSALCPLAIVDDLTRAVFPSALVVNPNTDASPEDYDLRHQPEFLLGPSYAVLASLYAEAARRRAPHEGPVRRVAIALGGGVLRPELLPAVVRAAIAAFGAELELDVIAGFDGGEALRASGALGALRGELRLLNSLPSIRDLLLAADVAIVSGGVTKYEAAVTGTPTVMIATVEHQVPWAESFAHTGAALYAGSAAGLSIETIAATAQKLADPALRRAMAERGAQVVDGRGSARIVAALEARAAASSPG